MLNPFAPPQVAVCVVSGEQIREKIRAQIRNLDLVIKTYDDAIAKKIEGADWVEIKDKALMTKRADEMTLPVIGDGVFHMTIDQWIDLCNRFGDFNSVEEYLEQRKKRLATEGARVS